MASSEHSYEPPTRKKLDERIGEKDKQIARLTKRVHELTERLDQLEAVVDVEMNDLTYEKMTKRDKVRQIQAHLAELAEESTKGTAAMNYREVRTLFNGKPSPGHAYDLMHLAADHEGFEHDEGSEDRNQRITVDLDAVNSELFFHTANNRDGSSHH